MAFLPKDLARVGKEMFVLSKLTDRFSSITESDES